MKRALWALLAGVLTAAGLATISFTTDRPAPTPAPTVWVTPDASQVPHQIMNSFPQSEQ